MSEYGDIINGLSNAAPAQTAATIDANPDEAARAIDLSKATGAPAPAIYGDIDGFERQHKLSMATDLVRNNPQLTAYVNSHPLASTVSNDDFGAMDKFSAGAAVTSGLLNLFKAPTAEAVSGFREGYGTQPYGEWLNSPYFQSHPLAWSIASAGWMPFEAASRVVSGLAGAAVGGVHGAALAAYSLTGDRQSAESFARDIKGMAEYELNFGQGMPHAPEAVANVARAQEAMSAARPWLEEGMEPPRGVHPDIDAAKAGINAHALDQLDTDLANAQESLTRERSPDLFRQFVEQHYGDATIGIHGDAVAGLYGDRIPTPGDGLLGWVPGIEDQLTLARETGADVHVPVADWLTHVDPQVANNLHDDIRMWPGGITAREAIESIEPKGIVDGPLPQVRGTSSLEPMFAVGDRKISLTPIESGSADFHAYQMLDERGQPIGSIELLPNIEKKQLEVQMVTGTGGMWANSFGPSLIRDLKRQLKEIYPEYETITGHRVTGARAAALGEEEIPEGPSAYPVVKLDTGKVDGWGEFDGAREILSGAWQQFHPKIMGFVRPTADYTAHEAEISRIANEEIARIAGTGPTVQAVHGIQHTTYPGRVRGTYLAYADRAPAILYDLFSPDPVGTARHESIHYLRDYGFFTPQEWDTLSQAAHDEGWLDRYNINTRYAHGSDDLKTEEAIAEGFREWMQAKEEGRAIETPYTGAFQKIYDLWQNIKARLKEVLGYEPTWDQLFEKIGSGKVAQRGTGEPRRPGVFRMDQEPMLSADDRFDNIRANALGLDLPSYRRLQEAINSRYAEDLAAATARAEKEQAKRQGREWRENRIEVRKEVEETIRQRPDVAADLFVGSGELHGQKLRQRYPLRADDLTAEQKAALPDHYYAASGLPVDDVAHMMGYASGDSMVQRLIEYNQAKEGRSPQEMLKKVIDDETNRQMEARYGRLGENVMDAAKDQALSETSLNLIAEEMYAAGVKSGQPAIDKDVAKAWAQEWFGKQAIGSVNSDRSLANVAKHGRDAERALIAGDPAAAMVSLQKKFISAVVASEARKLEKEVDRFDKDAKRLSARSLPSVDPEYMNFIHQVLLKIGKPIRRSVQDLEENIAAGLQKDLGEFVAEKEAQLRELPIAANLLDPSWRKDYKSLTAAEFREVRDSIKALEFNGRDELKITRAGEAADLEAIKSQMVEQLQTFSAKHYDVKGGRWLGPIPPKGAQLLRSFGAAHIQIENLLNRWDRFDPHGVWNQYVMRDLIDGASQEEAWKKEYSAKLRATKDNTDLSRTVTNPLFRDPNSKVPFAMTRANLRTVLLNVGNESNLDKLARGYGVAPDDIMSWLHQYATKEDWEWGQKIWDIFDDIKKKSDVMYRGLTGGVAPEAIPIRPVETPHGTYRGGYYPVIYHPEFEGASKKLMGRDALEQDNYIRATTPAGYTKGRTGYAAPMALDLDMLPNRINQMLHDIALRPAVINAGKIFYDKDIRAAIAGHYGTQYRDLLVPYLRDVANAANYVPKDQKQFTQAMEFLRQNLITTLVGFNPGTVAKHGPTALVLSMKEVGAKEFAKAAAGLFSKDEATGESNWQFAMQNSLELQRRDRNWQETLYGASNELTPGNKFMELRQKVMELASKPVALSDMLSAVPTWLARYEKSIGEGATHGDAIFDADRAVRRAHGSTAITNRPSIMRNANPWITSVYTFFNDVMNRQMELVWKAGDALGEAKAGNYEKAMAAVPAMAGGLFAYVLWPAIVEEIVSPTPGNQKESWAHKAADGLVHSLGASWIGVRDIANAIISAKDPSVGLLSTAGKELTDVIRDIRKPQPLSKAHAGRILQDATGLAGLATGMTPQQIGRTGRFIYGTQTNQEHPRDPWGWLTGLRYGTLKGHSASWEAYMRGR